MEAHFIDSCRIDDSTDVATNKQDCEQSLESQIRQSIVQTKFQSIEQPTYQLAEERFLQCNESCWSFGRLFVWLFNRSFDQSISRFYNRLIVRSIDCSVGGFARTGQARDSVTETWRAGWWDTRLVFAWPGRVISHGRATLYLFSIAE